MCQKRSFLRILESRYCLDSQPEKAKLASKARLCLRTPKAICSSFLIAAQTIRIGVLLFFFRRSANSLMILLCCFATIAGKYNARLIRALPSARQICLLQTDSRLSLSRRKRRLAPPATALNCNARASISLNNRLAVRLPMPGIVCSNWFCSFKFECWSTRRFICCSSSLISFVRSPIIRPMLGLISEAALTRRGLNT